jgi:ABC-type branched-subunit amino acid transport system substrate-binding protein
MSDSLSIPHLPRRRALLAAACIIGSPAVLAQPRRSPAPSRPITVAQVVDVSPAQQDVSKDFLIGSRAAWQEINSRGGLRGQPVQHLVLEVDGTPGSIRAAWASVRDNPNCVVLSGTAGDPVATRLTNLLRQDDLGVAHVAPWLQNATTEIDERTFPIFAARQEQIGHALKSLAAMGLSDLGVVYAFADDHLLYRDELERTAAALRLKLQSFHADGELARLGQRLTPATPAVLLFVGGTPELAQFTQGLERQQRQRYIVALADVNLQTLMQMGAARGTPVIATQAVPMVNAGLPVVRAYRDAMSRLFDEPPAPLSLAGFIAARYTYEVLGEVDGAPTRQSVLAAFQRRTSKDVGGFRVSFDPRRWSSRYVTQSMLTTDGRVVG